MSNNSSDKSSDVPLGQPSILSGANAASSNREEPQAKPSAPINLNNAETLHTPGELFDETSDPLKQAASVVNTNHDEPRDLAAAENVRPVREQTAEKTEGEGGRQVEFPVPTASATARQSAAARSPMDTASEGIAISQLAGQAKVSTQAGGAIPPGLPPAPVVASCPEEPKPTPGRSEGVQPPLLDVEEFIREAEDRKRGAKTMREVKALADYIRQLRQREVPFGAIHRGLKERGLVTCSRSRFDEICENLFPDLIDPKRRSNG